jgi:hypothetical protein
MNRVFVRQPPLVDDLHDTGVVGVDPDRSEVFGCHAVFS